jgi:ABC-type multidrug transport system ATPase subunit
VSEICDRVAIINQGKLMAVDTLKNLEKQLSESQVMVTINKKLDLANVPKMVELIEPVARKFAESLPQLKKNKGLVFYDINLPGFRVSFDGSIESQESLLKELVKLDIGIVEYTIPKTELLERLYIRMVESVPTIKKDDINIGGAL